jgi:hypothetical protein
MTKDNLSHDDGICGDLLFALVWLIMLAGILFAEYVKPFAEPVQQYVHEAYVVLRVIAFLGVCINLIGYLVETLLGDRR